MGLYAVGARTKPTDKIPTDKTPTTDFKCGCPDFLDVYVSHDSRIHGYYHHTELLGATYIIMVFWFILLLTETLILTIWC